MGSGPIPSWNFYTSKDYFLFDKPVYSSKFSAYSGVVSLEAGSSSYVQIQPRSSSYGLILREYNSTDYGNFEVTSAGLGIGYNTSDYNLLIRPNGSVGIGTSGTDGAKLSLKIGWGDWMQFQSISNTGYWGFHNNQGQKDFQIYYHKTDGTNIWPFAIRENGVIEVMSMGIGTANIPSDSKLAVDGKITCEEIEVKNVSADFVFDANYKLRSLKEVELFIKENGHLPDISPASETEKGVNLGEFNQTLLQKIEELTLYMIELKKEREELKSEIYLLKK